jgi:phosphoribosylcarboxyaminoimidazole (NCAIR) mutase
MTRPLVPIIMGSDSDRNFVENQVVPRLRESGFYETPLRVASAHKTPLHLYSVMLDYEPVLAAYAGHGQREQLVSRQREMIVESGLIYITVAGRQNALGNTVSAMTPYPVISLSPDENPERRLRNVLSAMDMPSGVAAIHTMNVDKVGMLAAKLAAYAEPRLNPLVLAVMDFEFYCVRQQREEFARELAGDLKRFGINYEDVKLLAYDDIELNNFLARRNNEMRHTSVVYVSINMTQNYSFAHKLAAKTKDAVISYLYDDSSQEFLPRLMNEPAGSVVIPVLEPGSIGLLAAKIFSLSFPKIRKSLREYQAELRDKIEEADKRLQSETAAGAV